MDLGRTLTKRFAGMEKGRGFDPHQDQWAACPNIWSLHTSSIGRASGYSPEGYRFDSGGYNLLQKLARTLFFDKYPCPDLWSIQPLVREERHHGKRKALC
jgi:hypothetical protein